MTGFYCASSKSGRPMCDQPALYLINGTALCRSHARQLIDAGDPPRDED